MELITPQGQVKRKANLQEHKPKRSWYSTHHTTRNPPNKPANRHEPRSDHRWSGTYWRRKHHQLDLRKHAPTKFHKIRIQNNREESNRVRSIQQWQQLWHGTSVFDKLSKSKQKFYFTPSAQYLRVGEPEEDQALRKVNFQIAIGKVHRQNGAKSRNAKFQWLLTLVWYGCARILSRPTTYSHGWNSSYFQEKLTNTKDESSVELW